ncbi:MAG: thioredoxin [Parcubacteria group bacterium CG_4_9_14_0_2_um_filter_41_8]|nr:MAG: thioredoxin [Parcubacteria group bacterium CG1_02_41_12]PIP67141.1 MAG: thioredoxin [Parcubacteria group bacterium CG22_combo_CG10-13_8_21_14_all_41_9]PIQ80143.1 MAG: thioredoxin [Parcubacteria group bacterium CG11_big_fil_rev_8_21_14_0_20_41_14]PIR57573.1 MAG: thioredoxin [Parcubacteria group bacterium CG10_big_fil_rev_8_21_14_0_10_41_35]PIZ80797.1 MAG: thioredoxin [Parcubacteria group bacterium CG_4_10_14_0_2_um_filter_41_6]PJC40856.1 MAG: thioredoxin [Parcubacteria group bacterium C
MPQELTLTDQNFKDEIKQGITLVDFWAPWCGPCQQQGPIIEELAKEVENAKVGKLNVDNNQITAQEFGVMSIPTLIIFKDGNPIETLVGVHQKEDLKKKIQDIAK